MRVQGGMERQFASPGLELALFFLPVHWRGWCSSQIPAPEPPAALPSPLGLSEPGRAPQHPQALHCAVPWVPNPSPSCRRLGSLWKL